MDARLFNAFDKSLNDGVESTQSYHIVKDFVLPLKEGLIRAFSRINGRLVDGRLCGAFLVIPTKSLTYSPVFSIIDESMPP